jgi:uracil-DNA glycosylase
VPTLEEIAAQVNKCKLCKLGQGNARGVPGEGNPNAEILMIGEAPGFYEDQQGRPFVGAAGQLLNELLGMAGLTRSEVFITNVVKHRPPANRDPEADELEACDGYLRAQIEAINPEVIVTLGRFSLAKFVPNVRAMRDVHGRAIPYENRIICAMYHPAAALHQASLRSVLDQDFRSLPMILAKAKTRAAGPAASDEAAPAPSADEPPPAQQMNLF